MSTIEFEMVVICQVRSLISFQCVFWYMFLEAHQNHMPFSCRCLIKRSDLGHFYHEPDYSHLACENLMIYVIVEILFVALQSWVKVDKFIMVTSQRSNLISCIINNTIFGNWSFFS